MGHIWLIGMMGSGKTSVGLEVASTIGLPFIDSDDRVVEMTGTTIADLFATGEETFRAAERLAVTEIAGGPDHVVATGGGVILDDGNVATMRDSGTTVLLTADPDELQRRLQDPDGRPLLVSGGDLAVIARDRQERYLAAADAAVDTTRRSIEDVAREVVACVRT